MDIRHLRYFAVLAKELHFARAAEILGITQPPLSRTIQNLEKELGVRLFSRENKWDIHLTEAGKTLLEEAEKILPKLDHAVNRTREAGSGICGRLTIGAISSMIGHPAFIDTLTQMQKKVPEAVIEIIDSTSGELQKMLGERTVDVALMRLDPQTNSSEFHAEKLYTDTLLAALPAGHRLADLDPFPISALRQERFILVPEKASSVFRNYVLNICRQQGKFEPVIHHEISNSYTALRLTAAKAGVTMVSSAYYGIFGDRVIYRKISGFQAALPMFAVHPTSGLSPLARKFLQELKKQLQKNRP